MLKSRWNAVAWVIFLARVKLTRAKQKIVRKMSSHDRYKLKLIYHVVLWLCSPKSFWLNDILLKSITCTFFSWCFHSSTSQVFFKLFWITDALIFGLYGIHCLWNITTTLNINLVMTPCCSIFENRYFNYHPFRVRATAFDAMFSESWFLIIGLENSFDEVLNGIKKFRWPKKHCFFSVGLHRP